MNCNSRKKESVSNILEYSLFRCKLHIHLCACQLYWDCAFILFGNYLFHLTYSNVFILVSVLQPKKKREREKTIVFFRQKPAHGWLYKLDS